MPIGQISFPPLPRDEDRRGYLGEPLREHGVRFADLPNEARAACAHKATMAGAQTAFGFGCSRGRR
ncbi:hypothetical protein C6Q13_00010 [Burkholderia gladioli]|nr:hypothetical protein C6Q13_00010 [Burkholderia gladioli]